jgi:8-oxo-dGTP pyrophosphatase MutT (NUDIX family)
MLKADTYHRQAMRDFDNVEELESWLRVHQVDVDSWGTGGSKTVATLWTELHRGESQLESTPLRRLVTVVRVIIRRGDRVLMETAQDFDDGRRRYRLQPPSEKMRPAELPENAAVRCLQEELGVPASSVQLTPGSSRRWERERESVSYPGLRTCYRFYSVEAHVSGLPDQPFSTREETPGPGEPVERHFWEWAPVSALVESFPD